MPVYNGSIKQKELYYGNSKIKEAYYGGTKVYSSRPLYYCYKRSNPASGDYYMYCESKVTTTGTLTYRYKNYYDFGIVTSSSQLTYSGSDTVVSVSGDTFNFAYTSWTYYPSGDLYT